MHRERRSVCVAELIYNPDGTIQKLPSWTDAGAARVGTFNPYAQVDAATICYEKGVKTIPRRSDQPGVYENASENGAYIKIKGVDFGNKSATTSFASLAAVTDGTTISLRLDSETGTPQSARSRPSPPVRWTSGKPGPATSGVPEASTICI